MLLMDPQADEAVLDLRDYLRIIRRRKWTIALVMFLVVGAALAAAFTTTPRYRSSAELLIAPRGSETLLGTPQGQVVNRDATRYIATEIKVLRSKSVEDLAVEKLGYQARISASGSGDDNVVTVSSTSEDADQAAETVNAYIAAYIEYRQETTVDDSLNAQGVIQQKIDEKQRQLQALDGAVRAAPAGQQEATLAAQQSERASIANQVTLFRSQVDQLQVGAGLNTGGAELLTSAEAASSPFDPNPIRSGVLALVLGLMLGVGLAFLVEYLDDSLRSKDDLERATRGLPVLGIIPTVANGRNTKERTAVTLTAPTSAAAEAYRSLRTSIQFLGLDSPVRTLQLTSPSAAEGKSTTAANLAIALANAGQRVVIVDCDLRRPRAHEFFALSNEVGFTSVLLGELPLSAALQPVPGVDGLRVLASGPRPPNPSELLSGHRTTEVLAALQAEADIVVVDSPPVLGVSDAVVLSARVDATLLVANGTQTSRKAVGRALELLHQIDASVIGTVLNGTTSGEAYGYGYGYGYGKNPYYRAEPSPEAIRSST